MKKMFLLLLMIFDCLQSCEVGNGCDKRLFSHDIKEIQEAINEGADVNARGDYNYGGRTALIDAAIFNKLEVAKLLIASGANINLKNNHGYTALMIAVLNNRLEMVKLLIDSGAIINVSSNE